MTASSLAVLTGERCSRLIQILAETYAASGLDFEASLLRRDMADVEWLSAFRGDVFRRGGPVGLSPERVKGGFTAATLFARTCCALAIASSYPGFDRIRSHLRNWRLRPRPGDVAARQADDHLFEVELAARFGTLVPNVEFGELDVTVQNSKDGPLFAFECKRAQSRDSISRCVQKAISQARKHEAIGAVAVCLDRVVSRSVVDRSGDDLRQECERRLRDVADAVRPEVLHQLRKYPMESGVPTGMVGALFCATFWILGRDSQTGNEYMNSRFVTHTLPVGGGGDALHFVQNIIERGNQNLIRIQRDELDI